MVDIPAFPALPARPRSVAACLLLVTTALAAGCAQSAGPPPTAADDATTAAESTDPTTGRDGMESRLVDLTAADDPAAFADAHGIAYEDGRVSVAVRLREGASFPDGHDADVGLSVDGTVQASVPVSELRALAAHENVTYVRTQREPNA